MTDVEGDTNGGPDPQDALFIRRALIETKDTDRCVEETIHDTRSCSEVVELFGDIEVPGVEDHAEDPARQTKIPKSQVVRTQRVSTWHLCPQPFHAVSMSEEVEEREEDGERFLHAQKSVEGPFSMKLDYRFHHWGVSRFSLVRNDMLTGIVTFLGAVPEEESQVKSYSMLGFSAHWYSDPYAMIPVLVCSL